MNTFSASGRIRRDEKVAGDSASTTALAFFLFVLLILFTLLNIPNRVPYLGVIRPTVLLVGLISVLIFMAARDAPARDTSKTTQRLNLLILYTVVTVPFVQWPGSVLRFGLEGFIKAAVFFYFTVHLIDSVRRLRVFVFTVLACQIFRVLEPLYLHLTTGYWGSAAHMGGGEFMARLSGAPSDIVNPNGLAFVVLTAIPFLHYLVGGSPSKWVRLVYLVLLPPVLYAFLLTGSRSGLVGLVVVYGFIMLRSKQKVLMALMAVAAAVVLIGALSGEQRDRYLSIIDSDARHSATSAGRVQGVVRDLAVALNRPIFGHGLGTSREALFNVAGIDQVSHNLYTEVLIELGVLGLVFYLRVLLSILLNVKSTIKAWRDGQSSGMIDSLSARHLEFCYRCSEATLAWFVMCLVFSLASYGLSEFYWYMVAGLSVAITNLVVRETGISPPREVVR